MLTEELYVFISYARPDLAVAEQVEAFLGAAGVRVFRDARDIRVGDNWDAAIERGLRECGRMVLLLSSSSMPERKEVHREWFYFDQQRKPIYPLYIEDCQLHSRIVAYNYIDARADLPGALERLLAELRRDAGPPQAAPEAAKPVAVEAKPVTAPEALQALLAAVLAGEDHVEAPLDRAALIRDHQPADPGEYRLCRIAEWSLPRHALDKRFVNLTLLLDQGEQEMRRWRRAEDSRFNDLRDVLAKTQGDPVLVLLGAPGSGKSTLLRRLQIDHSADRLRDGGEEISFFIQLNGYRARAGGKLPKPGKWLAARWASAYPQLPPLDVWLQNGKALLLLDALNEMPHKSADHYRELAGLWREFAQETARGGTRILFSCRSLDYGGAHLSSPDMPVPQIEIQPMNAAQVREFLDAYVPTHADRVWNDLDGKPWFAIFQTPYFLKLLCDQVDERGDVPKERAALFTGFVRQALRREIEADLFQPPGGLLDVMDRDKLKLNKWRNPFELPESGPLIPALSHLAYTMQVRGLETESAQVRLDYNEARGLIAHNPPDDLIDAGIALNVLDKDLTQSELLFFHQLLQEYFAARRLAKQTKPELIHVEWETYKVQDTLKETLAKLADSDPLPNLPQTGWEETAVTAAPMAKDQAAFIRDLLPRNLPLAARCAASPEVKIGDELKREIQKALIERTQDKRADLRARIAAGEALGTLGDPRFERRTGPHGDYLLPPLVAITGGTYPMGLDKSDYDDETPAHKVELAPFQIGQFPVTNAEYKLFIEAGGYDDPQWWDTEESLAWLRGEASMEGVKQGLRDFRTRRQEESEDDIRGRVKKNLITSEEAENWIAIRNMTDEEFEQQLEKWYPAGKLYRQPEYWDDTRFNNPAQPVVGITWFEARAFCNWLTASVAEDVIYRLPTEAEFEAAARGAKGRMFPYGKTFDSARCNTFESHIRRTTPKPGEQIKGSGQNDHFIGHFEILSLCKSD